MNIATVTITIIRPDTSAPFFYNTEIFQTLAPEIREFSMWAMDNNLIMFLNPEGDEDSLTMTRTTYFYGEEEKNKFLESFSKKFPDFNRIREEYCLEHNHILEREV
jgi:hypothetical protein